MTRNVISVDVELWSDRDYLKDKIIRMEDDESSFFRSLEKILSLFDKHGQTGTFFMLGKIVEKYPEVVEQIADKGHEVALHGWSHDRLDKLTEEEFEGGLIKCVDAVRRVTGERPKGFRAPQFSFKNETRWALKILIDKGFLYDSSIFPCRTPLYGASSAPPHPYYPSLDDIEEKSETQMRLMELPLLTNRILNLQLPAAGGFWLRFFGPGFIDSAIKKMNRLGFPSVIFFHPWEVDKIALKPWNLRSVYASFRIPATDYIETLLRNNKFCSAVDLLEELG
jgi:polysaccharide deacetylase family protein (PEP-CTERM system associated)